MYIRVVKNNFYVFRNYFEETEFSEKFSSCLVDTRTLSIISSDFCDKIFRKVFKTASYTFRRKLWWKTILLKNLLQSFGLWPKQFFFTDDIFFVAKLSKLLSTTSGEHFDKKLFWKTLPRFFRTVSKLFAGFRQNFYGEVVQTVLYMFRKHFEDADFLNCFVFGANSDFEQIFSWLSAQTFL